MDLLRYLLAVVLLAGTLIYSAYWIVAPASSPVVEEAQASEAAPALPAAVMPPLMALSPVYPTMVRKGTLPASGPSAEQMRKKVQGERAYRPEKKRKAIAQGQKKPVAAALDAYASSPAPQSQTYLPYVSEENR